MILSIIIPTYNCKGKIEKCLDSIYSQDIDLNDFEVICVDDCSPDASSIEAIYAYKYANFTPHNLKIINHHINKRQGGARNTGVKYASGEYIRFIDQDDIFLPCALKKSIQCLFTHHPQLDMAMCDFSFRKDGCERECQYPQNNDKILNGINFLKENELTWAPWGYYYRREFLLKHNLKFVENVQFEDADFVIRCILKASTIKFIPQSVILYTVNEDSQTNIGMDTIEKIDFFFNLAYRINQILETEHISDNYVRYIIKSHANFAYKIATYRLIYLRKYADKKELGYKYLKNKFLATDGKYLYFASEFTRTYLSIIHIASPFLRYAIRLRKLKRKYSTKKHQNNRK